MQFRTLRRLGHRRWLSAFVAGLAIVSQLAVVLSPLIEGRDGIGAAAHVDPAGTQAHFAHNDADCAACQVRPVHGTAARLAPTIRDLDPRPIAPTLARVDAPSADFRVPQNPRAPPQVN